MGLLRYTSSILLIITDLQKFKWFLESVANEVQHGPESGGTTILLAFLKSHPSVGATLCHGLASLLQAWKYAAHVNNDGLLAVIPNVLAILLETISSSIDFSKIGVQICKTLLEADNAELLDKCLNHPRARESSARPCLRLLVQIISFDGGACAQNIYVQRHITLRHLISFLKTSGAVSLHPDRSLRSYAVLFLLRNFRFQGKEAKTDILSQSAILRHLLQGISSDEHEIILETLSTLTDHVLLDSNLTRAIKARILTDTTLKPVLDLSKYTQGFGPGAKGDLEIQEAAQDFLLTVCTSESHGIVFRQHGWYPPGTEENIVGPNTGLHTVPYSQFSAETIYTDRVPVRNTTLASFVQELRPWAYVFERDLILAIFQAAPELVADYFLRKKALPFDPKLSATWVGYATFVFSVIRLSPLTCGMYINGVVRCPPATSVLVESILPRPLTTHVLNRCLNQGSRFVKLLAVRILIAALNKLQMIYVDFTSNDAPVSWTEAASQLICTVQQRLPDFRFVKAAFQACTKSENALKGALASLVSLFYRVLPQASLRVKFDASSHLLDTLVRVQDSTLSEKGLSTVQELESLLEVASYSFETRWFQKPGLQMVLL